jgi:ABC-2 type transport system permease protein
MRTLFILYKKELKHFIGTPFGWIVLSFIVLLQGFSLTSVLEQYEKSPVQVNLLFSCLSTPIFWFYFIFIFPLITMKQFAEEERSGTLENLMTSPVTTWQVVLSKYLSSYTFYLMLWLPLLAHLKIFEMVTGSIPPVTTAEMIGAFSILTLAWIARSTPDQLLPEHELADLAGHPPHCRLPPLEILSTLGFPTSFTPLP